MLIGAVVTASCLDTVEQLAVIFDEFIEGGAEGVKSCEAIVKPRMCMLPHISVEVLSVICNHHLSCLVSPGKHA